MAISSATPALLLAAASQDTAGYFCATSITQQMFHSHVKLITNKDNKNSKMTVITLNLWCKSSNHGVFAEWRCFTRQY